MGRPKANLELTEVQRQELERMVRAGRSEKRMVFRARLILECASGADNVQVARRLGTTEQTVTLWRVSSDNYFSPSSDSYFSPVFGGINSPWFVVLLLFWFGSAAAGLRPPGGGGRRPAAASCFGIWAGINCRRQLRRWTGSSSPWFCAAFYARRRDNCRRQIPE
jgi:hypothetical protein